ncbi:phosphomethylpyrimidine kinase [Thermanaerovibrio acidaminovorans DSM 6589]|uniref:hydroxymethylpyrimidine kinase n=1 Tax=Thermanaerovibrio acidaminovorans (strain ATCC 49978 / DSM 6589 / Su883) TaxID=525903 RepID=D1B7D2_THEAS|nr:bifunctional hydroxymethylpyrimidine kinase/phosphomethylpyrimidine kinase [Thermanaerovibrio acidaminovorans]ACZ19923.1 phosphomethylpyrimidine kinase [Thermanaerovibrio acidaminovorans DSM 6589]
MYRGVAMTIAGSDSGGGAGIQADLKTFMGLNVFGVSAVTAVTAQNSMGVYHVENLSVRSVREQIRCLLSDFPVRAVKIGMLSTGEIMEAVAEELSSYPGPVVLDPVMVSQSGHSLMDSGAERAMRERLLPLASLVTPNLPEAERLLGLPPGSIATKGDMLDAANRLLEAGCRGVLLKGGHLPGDDIFDVLICGAEEVLFEDRRIPGGNDHGTGCTLSSAIAAELAAGEDLKTAVTRGREFVRRGMETGVRLGRGHGCLYHRAPAPWVGDGA